MNIGSPFYNAVINYIWSFGDRTGGYGKFITHAYSSPGKYKAVLKVLTPGGAHTYAAKIIEAGGI